MLHHEGVDAATAAGLVPAIGLPVPDAIRELHDRWGMDRLDAGAHLSATPDELRRAGCTTAELLQAAPREVLRRLDTREHTWELAAHSLLEAGLSTPTRSVSSPCTPPRPRRLPPRSTPSRSTRDGVFPVAAREASVPDLVALSERYGLSPAETAEVLVAACAPPAVVTDVVLARCDGDVAATVEACRCGARCRHHRAGAASRAAGRRADRAADRSATAGLDDAALAAALGDPATGVDLGRATRRSRQPRRHQHRRSMSRSWKGTGRE